MAFVAAGVASVAMAQTGGGGSLTYVLCVTNEASTPVTIFVDDIPEASGPRTGYGAQPNTPYCYRRVVAPGSAASIVVDNRPALAVEDIRTAADFERLAAQMQAQRELPASCEYPAAIVEQADVEQRKAVLVRVFAADAGSACEVSVGAAPTSADGLDSFNVTRSGGRPVYYESAERQSFALCVAGERQLEVAVWPQVRPQLPPEFLPRARVVRTAGGAPWCSRIWLRPGGDVAVLLGAIDAREEPNSPDFSQACSVSADLIAQARTGERRGVLVSVSRRGGRRLCAATLMTTAPERALGLNAFDTPPTEPETPS